MKDLLHEMIIGTPKRQYPALPRKKTLYSLSCSLLARDFFSCVEKNNISAICDTRLWKRYRGYGFATQQDDFRFHCETFGVTYVSANILAPTQEIRDTFRAAFIEPTIAALRNDNAWTTYLESYEALLQQRKPIQKGVMHDLLYRSRHDHIALVCSCGHHDDCHRSYACGIFERYISNVEVEILYPKDGKPPKPKSPRRYRKKDFIHAGLLQNAPRRSRGE